MLFFFLCLRLLGVFSCGVVLYGTYSVWLRISIWTFRVSTLQFCPGATRTSVIWRNPDSLRCVSCSSPTVTHSIHLWAKNHQHQTHLHRHHSGVAYLPPRVVLHLAHTTYCNLACFPQGSSFLGLGWGLTSKVGWDRLGQGGVGFLVLLSLHLVFSPCLNLMFTCSSSWIFWSFPCHCFLSVLLLLLYPPSSFLSLHLCFSLLRLTGLCLYVVCPFRPTPCIAG